MARKPGPAPLSAKQKLWQKIEPLKRWFLRTLTDPGFKSRYLIAAITILLTSTLLWSLLGISVQQNNADQLVNTELFHDHTTFQQAQFPSQHSFLIKWPLFWLINLMGLSGWAFTTVSVLCVLMTIGGLAFVLSRIERRPIVLGTLFIALSSCLLLIPNQPYPGGLLPVNMAMLTTRNFEYLIYLASIYLIYKAGSLWRSRQFWGGTSLLLVLIASDKLFFSLALTSAGLTLLICALAGSWNLARSSARWLMSGLIAAAGAMGLLLIINNLHITRITSQTAIDPYGLVHSAHNLLLGCLYGILGLLTNFGANPAFDATIVKQLPSTALHRLFGFEGPAMLINFLLFIGGLWALYKVVRLCLTRIYKNDEPKDYATSLSLALAASLVAALGAFITTNHYYAVDARYLTVGLFTVFIAAASYTRRLNFNLNQLVLAGGIMLMAMLFSLPGVLHEHDRQQSALAAVRQRNNLIAQALKNHPVASLVGDYWRVLPIRLASKNSVNIAPLSNCTTYRQDLSSRNWQPDLRNYSFAYLLSLDRSLTDYPNCTLDGVIKAYGRPNTSAVIAGPQDNPSELLLFYDQGKNKSAPTVQTTIPSTVLPIPLSDLPYTSCPNGTTIMNIVAHEDDDLLFINPDTQRALKANSCVRTVYITAGDAGADQFYWLSREQGSEAAYSTMLNSKEIWIKRVVQIAPHEYADISHPRNDYRASLIFIKLPDGSPEGHGFKRYSYESLAGLESGRITTINSVDNQSSYSSLQLLDALVSLMHAYQPVEVRTQADDPNKTFPDHSDHITVGHYATKAAKKYSAEQFENNVQLPVKYYMGYPIHNLMPDITDGDLIQKEAAWFAYASHDAGVCHNQQECNKNSAYSAYLPREYEAPR